LRILDSIKFLGLEKKTKFYQASTSELFGEIQEKKQSEKQNFILKVLMQHQNFSLTG
jgi:GDPmannose 4,6-dehydratase